MKRQQVTYEGSKGHYARGSHKWQHITWTTQTIWVDIDTGELLTAKKAKEDYIVISVLKSKTISNERPKGVITLTKQCQRSRQTKLFPTD